MDSKRTARNAVLALALALTWAGSRDEAAAQTPKAGGPTRTEKDLLGEKQIPADASAVNWHLSDHLRLSLVYGYGSRDRFELIGKTHFFQTRIQLLL
jgi:hypothetical protein